MMETYSLSEEVQDLSEHISGLNCDIQSLEIPSLGPQGSIISPRKIENNAGGR